MRYGLWLVVLTCGCGPDETGNPFADGGIEPFVDAGWNEDVGRAPGDTSHGDADAGPSDGGDVIAAPLPTWADCRIYSQRDSVDPETMRLCQQLHRASPPARRFGIRWVFLNAVDDPTAWTQERIDVANRLYADTDIEFETSTIVEIEDSVVDVLNGQTQLSLADRVADLVAHLGLQDDQPAAVINAFKARLLAVGCDPERVGRLGGNTRLKHGVFLAMMARSFHEEIYVVIGDRPSIQAGVGGFSSPPIRRFDWLQRSYIALKTSHQRRTILAHELGHYLGLKHPHSLSQEGEDSCRFNSQQVEANYRARESHQLWQVLSDVLGEALDGELPEIYPAFDATNEELLDTFAARLALADTWARRRFVVNSQFEPFESFAAYIEHWRSGAEFLQRNFMYVDENGRNKNNCVWQEQQEVFACTYPQHQRNLSWDHALLDGVILFDSGRLSNLMSYIRQPGNAAPARQAGFSHEQMQIIDLSANASARLGLRNHALAD
jgi:hypothetical protein